MLHPERFGYHPNLMHMVIVASHFMRFGFQDDNQKVGIDPSELLDTCVISKTAKQQNSKTAKQQNSKS